MSRRIAIITVLLTFGISATAVFLHTREDVQGMNEMKSLSLKRPQNILIKTSKLKPSYEIRISKVEADAVQAGATFTLEVHASTMRVLNTLNYSWVLPEGVSLVSGTMTGSVSNLNPKNAALISAQFSQQDGENKVIYLKTWLADERDPQLTTVQYNTVLQDEMDYERAELAKRNSEITLEQQSEQVKTHK
jgi:hypothetical protein